MAVTPLSSKQTGTHHVDRRYVEGLTKVAFALSVSATAKPRSMKSRISCFLRVSPACTQKKWYGTPGYLSAGAKYAHCSMASHDDMMVNPQAEAAARCNKAYASQHTLWLTAGSTSNLPKLIATTM